MTMPGMNLNHPDSPDVIQALETRCRHCDVRIIYLEHISKWWHITGQNVTHAYRGCRDTKGNLIGDHLAEPEEKT